MAPATRLAILECDTPMTQTKAKYGGYGGVFEALFAGALQSRNIYKSRLIITKWDVVIAQEYPQLGTFDAILITGGRFNSYDSDPWIVKLVGFVSDLLTSHPEVRITGFCFGHQIAGRALGAKVGPNQEGWEVSVTSIDLTPDGIQLFGGRGQDLQMHRDIVYDVPEGAINLGSSFICPVQGLYIPDQLLTFQGHPEFNEEIVKEILYTRSEQNIISEKTFRSGMDRVNKDHDGLLVAEVVLKFLNILP